MERFSLENNIYIKDIFSDPNAVGSWIYKVDNVEYYVPNFGYILMIDSKYADIEINQDLVKKPKSLNQKYKIYGSIYKENSGFDTTIIKSLIMSQFRSIIDPDNFRHNLKIKGGSPPPEEIMELLEKMWNNRNDFNSIKDYIKYKSNAYPELNIDPNTDFKRVGLFVGYELFVNKISLEAQVGYYVYRPFIDDIAVYDRIGFKYHFNPKIFTSFSVKTHMFFAEALEFGVGVRL